MSSNQIAAPLPAAADSLETVITYGGRLVDIRRFIGLNDYWLRSVCDPTDRSLLWFRHGFSETEIVRLPWNGSGWDESQAEYLAPYGRRACWQPMFNKHHGSMFVIADEENNESLNVYRFTPGDDGLKQVSFVGYLSGYSFSPVSHRLLIVGRDSQSGVESFLYEMNVDAPESLEVLHADVPEYRIDVFQPPVIDAEDRRVALTMLKNNRLSNLAIGIYRRDEGRFDIIDLPGRSRTILELLGWRGNHLLFISDYESAKEEVWIYDDSNGTTSRLFANPQRSASGIYDSDVDRLLLNLECSRGSDLVLVDADSGMTIASQKVDGYEFLWSRMSSAIGENEYVVSTREDSSRTIAGIANLKGDSKPLMRTGFEPEVVRNLDSSCVMKDVSYATFDLGEDGKPREIQGVLFLPKQMPESPSKRAAIIYAHGGPTSQTTKSWAPTIQFLCGLGYIVFGPNPRGSHGKGRTFEQLNDNDWGGADFRDYCHGLLYLLREYGLSARRVGIFGDSYGGYMTNWAMTRPNTPFAFGISMYGLSDLLLAIKKSVIAGMTLSEMGDPYSDEEIMQKYKERSPITWADHLIAPLLLIHGSRDNRTVTDQSRSFYRELLARGKDNVSYLEVEGEGHGFKTVKARYETMQAMADFLWKFAPVLSEEELEREDMLDELHDELIEVVQAALEVAADPTDENERRVQSQFDQTRQRIWEKAKQLRAAD